MQDNNIITKADPGFVNFHSSATVAKAADYDLVAGSQAIDKATPLPEIALDFLNRPVPDPTSGKPDIGAFEYNSTQAASAPPTFPGTVAPSHGNLIGAGGTAGKGGAGGTTAPVGTGGTPTVPTGKGGSAGSGGRTGGVSGGVSGSGGSSTTPPPAGSGGSRAVSGGDSGSGGSQGSGGNTGTKPVTGQSGCSCRLDHQGGGPGMWASLIGFALVALRRRGRRTAARAGRDLPRRHR